MLYQQAEDLFPGKPVLGGEILVAYGRLLSSLGRIQDGIEKDRQALEMNPNSRDAHYELAKGLDQEGDFKSAVLEG